MPYDKPYPANPSGVRQAPDHKALNKTTTLVVGSQPLATPFEAALYFEPGINTKPTKRKTPKVNFTLPSDLPTFPLGFVPTNQTPGARGEEPSIVIPKEAVPADLLDMFSAISRQQLAESTGVEAAKVQGRLDVGSIIAQQYQAAVTERQTQARADALQRQGFTPEESIAALQTERQERAVQTAKTPVPSAVVSVEEALAAKFPTPKPDGDAIRQFKAAEAREKFVQEAKKEADRQAKEREKAEGIRLAKGAPKGFLDVVERMRQDAIAKTTGKPDFLRQINPKE